MKIANRTFARHKTHVKKYKGNIPAIYKISESKQQPKPQLSNTLYITLLLQPDYPEIDNNDAENDTDLTVNTSSTEPYAETESE